MMRRDRGFTLGFYASYLIPDNDSIDDKVSSIISLRMRRLQIARDRKKKEQGS